MPAWNGITTMPVAQPVRALGLEQRPRRHPAVDLAALDREIDVGPAAIAGDDLELSCRQAR